MRPAEQSLTVSRIPELDGARGLAMSLVLVRQYLAGQVHTTPGTLPAYGMKLFSLTWAGVDTPEWEEHGCM